METKGPRKRFEEPTYVSAFLVIALAQQFIFTVLHSHVTVSRQADRGF